MTSDPLVLFVRFIYAVCITVAYSFSTVDNIPVHGYAVTTYDKFEWFSTLVRILLMGTFVFIFLGDYGLHCRLSVCI